MNRLKLSPLVVALSLSTFACDSGDSGDGFAEGGLTVAGTADGGPGSGGASDGGGADGAQDGGVDDGGPDGGGVDDGGPDDGGVDDNGVDDGADSGGSGNDKGPSGGAGGNEGMGFDLPDTNSTMYAPMGVHNFPNGVPVVIGFHGAGDNGRNFINVFLGAGDWKNISGMEGLIVLALNGSGGNEWQYPYPGIGAPGTRDIERVEANIDYLRANYNIDNSRIYTVGFSMGSTMAIETALYLDDTIAGFAAVAQGLPVNDYSVVAPDSGYKVPGYLSYSPADSIAVSIPPTASFLMSNGHEILLKEGAPVSHVDSIFDTLVGDPAAREVWNFLGPKRNPNRQ